ncbi:MAG TPA: RNA polymerase sigma factor [Pyrinomonadaceae bacterium]|nr:RNA polymerase sigma factor [Pyrinomonadaceae bacterium]
MDGDVQELLNKKRYEKAFEQLLELYGKKVFRMAVMMLKDVGRAEEVTQDIFLKLWQALPAYDGRAAPSTWLYTIARNTCLSAVRAESYRRTMSLNQVSEPTVSNLAPLKIAWEEYLSKLPEIQREVITLFYLEEKNIKDVAELLDLPEGTVKSHLHRARRALGKMME